MSTSSIASACPRYHDVTSAVPVTNCNPQQDDEDEDDLSSIFRTMRISSFLSPLNKECLRKLHEQQLNKGGTNADRANDIMTVLGGIDEILTNYLQYEYIHLDDQQLEQLHAIIASNSSLKPSTPKIQPAVPVPSVSIIERNHTSIQQLDVNCNLSLKTHNNFLFSLLSAERYHQAMTAIHSKLCKATVLISIVVWFTLVATKITLLWAIYIIAASVLFWIPYCVLYILSVNRTAFQYVLKSFDFWVKIIYLCVWGLFELSHRFILQKNNFDSPVEHTLSVAAYVLFDTVCIFILLITSSFDGFPTKQLWTIMMPGVFAVIAFLYSMYYQFQGWRGDDSIVAITDDIQFSLRGAMANAQRVIGIFFAKQSYLAWKYRERATSINIKPTIVWIRSKDTQTTQNPVGDKNRTHIVDTSGNKI